MKKKKPLSKLKNEAARLLQKLRRMESANDDGMATCVTCEKVVHWKLGDGGHYIDRGHSSTLLDERNINFQCKGCNGFFMKTTLGILTYQRFMKDWYGEDVTKEIEEKAVKLHKWDRGDLDEKVADYKARIKEQEGRLGD